MRLLSRAGLANRARCLAFNEELRKDRKPFALPDSSGHVAFQMPELDYWYWVYRNPDLGASDAVIAKKAWEKFLRTDEGRPYLINPNEGKKMPNAPRGIIVR